MGVVVVVVVVRLPACLRFRLAVRQRGISGHLGGERARHPTLSHVGMCGNRRQSVKSRRCHQSDPIE